MTGQPSLRDSYHLKYGNPTLKRRAIFMLSLRDGGEQSPNAFRDWGRDNRRTSLRDEGE
jgi:hypothetical protein